MRKLCIILLFIFINFITYAQTTFWDDLPDNICAARIAQEMTTEELLGQVLMFGYGWNGYSWDEVRDDLDFWINKNALGNIKIFGWNGWDLEQLAAEITSMQKLSQKTTHKVPLLLATDQEGGWIQHVKGYALRTPGNLAIGATSIMQDAYLSGFYIGRELKTLGINMNFAPDVDLFTNYDNYTIGPRTFSDSPELAGKLGLAFYLGTKAAGIIATAKHFPGHGDTTVDSHGRLPVINIDFDTWWERELVPYRLLIDEGIPAIMSGHLGFPQIDPDLTPSSLSGYFINEILRDKLGYDGIVVTDDLDMDGALAFSDYHMGKTCYHALNAGNDIALVSRTHSTQKKAYNYLLNKMENEEDFLNRIREKAEKIIMLKLEYLKNDGPGGIYADSDSISEKIPDRDGMAFFLDLAYRSTTLIKDEDIPLVIKNDEKILAVGQKDAFFDQVLLNYPDAEEMNFYYVYYEDESRISDIKKKLGRLKNDYDIILFCLDTPGANVILEELKGTKARVFVISVLSPVYIRDHTWLQNYIEVYSFGDYSMQAGFDALKGKFLPTGVMPLNLGSGIKK